ncbi:3-phosphoshikimate 1-carboxyvinyltransferase [Roseimaritima ulvae]|uniref:3-phosphoshikimate 1-carboxyvinyltransferase n=1 Tax=Roseimaritima ulvae TaxID=980254 RepID=A0A5B9R7E4_9BACT|nr:3-phosphoshikimate 1-carboxyvinyltransferase [Roseimaritima ulvae]QEG42353.1 3-phosphoshikimate 1-carboxyvinyltransferase [Roseimaritima ulvae]
MNSQATSTTVTVQPGGPVSGTIRPPGSKSLTNRALLCAAVSESPCTLRGALRSEDTAVMLGGLQQLGVDIESSDGGRTLAVDGSACRPQHADEPAELYIANSGTTVRFLTAWLSALGGDYRLHGVPRMHERPIGELLDAISAVLDGTIRAESPGGCPPVRIHSRGWRGGEITVRGNVSSQYLSGLLMAAPLAQTDVCIRVEGALVSQPYVQMTCQVLRSFGVPIEAAQSLQQFRIPAGSQYRLSQYDIEPDASAASYFWAAAAITAGRVRVEGLTADALQGDVGFVDVLAQMGCTVQDDGTAIEVTGGPLRGVDVDMNAISDTVQTLAVVALFAEGPTRVRGVAHNRFKETDRIADLACELRKLGAVVSETEDGLQIEPLTAAQQQTFAGARLDTYHDHRMAMSLSLVGLRLSGVQIQNPSCTAKTYPEYFADLESLLRRPHHWRTT